MALVLGTPISADQGMLGYEVTADGEGLVSHAGVALLVELADRVGLTGALSDALALTRERRSAHDPGRVLRDVAVMLADGGDCVTDMWMPIGVECPCGMVMRSCTVAYAAIFSVSVRPPHQ